MLYVGRQSWSVVATCWRLSAMKTSQRFVMEVSMENSVCHFCGHFQMCKLLGLAYILSSGCSVGMCWDVCCAVGPVRICIVVEHCLCLWPEVARRMTAQQETLLLYMKMSSFVLRGHVVLLW